MSEPPITPILLCGGSGSRLWPLSRKSFPKQFARFTGEDSLFQASARRLRGPGFAPPVIVSATDYRFIVTEQLAQVGIAPGAILIEPEPRNTAPAILAAALHAASADPAALLLVAPCDHVVPDAAAFHAALGSGLAAARAGRIVTFGITPDRPETGYGYLEPEAMDKTGAQPLRRFIEKPDAAEAARMLADGGYLWNAGIFLFAADTLLQACRAHAPALLAAVEAALDTASPDLGFLRLGAEAWGKAEAISIDYAIMERAGNLSVVRFAGRWSDLGGWDAVWRESPRDADGVATSGAATAIDCRDTLLRSEHDDLRLVGLGLDGIVAVAMPDAVLVADRSRAQEVRLAVEGLKSAGARQAETFPRDHRPWGWFETLALGPRFRVKRICVHPGGKLSLQSHRHRAEHWIVVAGTATVTIGRKRQLVTENQSVYIPLGEKHRLENEGKVDLQMVEVQTGAYLGEDDIQRFEDAYARS